MDGNGSVSVSEVQKTINAYLKVIVGGFERIEEGMGLAFKGFLLI